MVNIIINLHIIYINSCMLSSCCLLTFFKINFFSKNSFRNTIRMSNSLDPDQDCHYVSPDLGPSCLQRISADKKNYREQGNSSINLPFKIF